MITDHDDDDPRQRAVTQLLTRVLTGKQPPGESHGSEAQRDSVRLDLEFPSQRVSEDVERRTAGAGTETERRTYPRERV
eukprot:3633039-Rhodomonas_salina.2